MQEWGPLIAQAGRSASSDTFLPVLAERLAAISRTGINAAQLLHTAINTGPLPDEHGAAALWWRISRHLQPAVTADTGHDDSITTPWAEQLTELVGADRAQQLQHSRLWPALVSVVDHALAARLATRAAPHPRHVAPRSTTNARRWCGGSPCSPTPHPTRTQAYPPPADPGIDIEPHATQQPAGRADPGHRPADPHRRSTKPSLTVADRSAGGRARIVGLRPTWPSRRWSGPPGCGSSRPTPM